MSTEPARKKQKRAAEGGDSELTSSSSAKATTADFLGVMRDALVISELYTFLDVNEVTDLSMTCKDMSRLIKQETSRTPFPRFLRQRRLPTMVGYENLDDDDDYMVVSQTQKFNFCVSLHDNRKVIVSCLIENEIWEEYKNAREGAEFMAPLDTFPRPSRIRVYMTFPLLDTQRRERLFIAHPSYGWNRNEWLFIGGHSFVYQDEPRSKRDKKTIRQAMDIMYACTKRIENYGDGIEYPTSEYLMRTLPDWFYPYFPKSFDWSAACKDRETDVEVEYCQASSLSEWSEWVPDRHSGVYRYFLDAERPDEFIDQQGLW